MPLSSNDIKSRSLSFSRTWAAAAFEDSQGKPFWIDFFEIFDITKRGFPKPAIVCNLAWFRLQMLACCNAP